jgi:hypothetical protein
MKDSMSRYPGLWFDLLGALAIVAVIFAAYLL